LHTRSFQIAAVVAADDVVVANVDHLAMRGAVVDEDVVDMLAAAEIDVVVVVVVVVDVGSEAEEIGVGIVVVVVVHIDCNVADAFLVG
jgi:hypothetical protein